MTPPPPRPLRWLGSSKRALLAMPERVIDEMGFVLGEVQHRRPHPALGALSGLPGVQEIRAHDAHGTYRTGYVVNLSTFIYVLHCFQKKSTQGVATSRHDLDLIRQRLKLAQEDDRDHQPRH